MIKTLKNGKPTDPIEMLKEIEAYLTFKLIGDNPNIPMSDMQSMKNDIIDCLLINGHDLPFKG